jgi:hypothetical protein
LKLAGVQPNCADLRDGVGALAVDHDRIIVGRNNGHLLHLEQPGDFVSLNLGRPR